MSQGPNAPDSMASTSDDRPGSLQEGIPRIRGRRFKTYKSPAHDDYATYFVPPELTHVVKQRNSAAQHHDSPAKSAPQIVDVVAGNPSTNDTFDSFTYVPFGLDPENDPGKYPWPVPVLELIQPSPPDSIHEDIASLASKKSETRTSLEQKRKPTVGVTWGERETHACEVESSREDKGESLATASPSRSRLSPIPASTENVSLASKALSKNQRRKDRRHFKSDHNEQTHGDRKIQCLDIMQSKWDQDPDDPSEEIVSLTSFGTSQEVASAETSFRWVHIQRERIPISFEDFEDMVLYNTPDLWDYEVAVASKCMKEVKLKRKGFAGGKYYEPTVYQAHGVLSASAVEKVPVHATFLSMPIFAVLPSGLQNESRPTASNHPMQSLWRYISRPFEDDDDAGLPYWNSRDLRSSRVHPIRTLLQYYNIVAIDDERDRRQVITKFARDANDQEGYIHVPEFWALTINMYTIITCAPFSAEDLCGENVKIKLKAPQQKDQRIFVKYTNLQGRLHDFRCRTWFGLLDVVAGLEQIDDMQTLLNDVASDFKLIDPKFRPINEARFNEVILAEEGNTKVINVRLIRVLDDNPLTLAFAAKKLSDCVRDTIILVGLTGVLAELRAKEVRLRKQKAEADIIDQLKVRVKRFTEIVRKHHRSRMLNRLLLYAARCQILDPQPRRSERNRDRAMIRRLAVRTQQFEKELERLGEEERRLQEAKQSVASIRSEKDSGPPRVPQIVINDETTADVAISPFRRSTTDSNPQSRSESSRFMTPQISESVRNDPAMQQTQTLNFGDQGKLPSSRDLSTIATTQTDSVIHSEPPHMSPRDLTSMIPSIGLPCPPRADVELQRQQRHHPLVFQRRHSIAGHLRTAPSTVLPASPPRLPLRPEGDSATLVPSRWMDRVRPTSKGSKDKQLPDHDAVAAPKTLSTHFELNRHVRAFQSVSSRAQQKREERFSGPIPFFEVQKWPRAIESMDLRATETSIANQESSSKDDITTDDPMRSNKYDVSIFLSHIDDLICDGDSGKHNRSLASVIMPKHYNKIELKSESDVTNMLEKLELDERRSTDMSLSRGDDHPQSEFLKANIELFLGVHGLLGCFIHHEARSESKLVGKVWGIVYRICELNLHSMPISRPSAFALTLSPPKHDTQYIDMASEEIRRFEYKWKSLLAQVRADASTDGSAHKYQAAKSLLPAFRNIVLFLLCALLAVNENNIDFNTFKTASGKLNDGIRESTAAFLRMTELAEMASEDQIGDESIRTADTLLGLLLENAFLISSREHVDKQGARRKTSLDIEHIYSTYTSRCITRAKREASARLYEDVLLLKEEIEAIKLVLKDQGKLFQEALKKRESPLQNLDLRLNERVISKLQERAEHFNTLSEYAEQAETWTRNSIEVRGENNNKAIFIFTTVTIIFLPLTFISGVMGMNTADVRQMQQGQWLFWAVAVPFTILVLVVCLCIVQYKFKLRRRFRTIVYWPLAFFHKPETGLSKVRRASSDA